MAENSSGCITLCGKYVSVVLAVAHYTGETSGDSSRHGVDIHLTRLTTYKFCFLRGYRTDCTVIRATFDKCAGIGT